MELNDYIFIDIVDVDYCMDTDGINFSWSRYVCVIVFLILACKIKGVM